jgi:hypothetical protein
VVKPDMQLVHLRQLSQKVHSQKMKVRPKQREQNRILYYTSLTSHWLKLNHMTWNNINVLWKLTQTGNNPLHASKGKHSFKNFIKFQNSKINKEKKNKVQNFQKILNFQNFQIRVITKLPNSEQSYKKVTKISSFYKISKY